MNNFFNRNEIIRFLAGECSIEERREIEEWMKEDRGNEELVNEYRKTWQVAENLQLEQDEDLAWQKLSQRIVQPDHLVSIHHLNKKPNVGDVKCTRSMSLWGSHTWVWLLRGAAVFLVLVCVSYLLYEFNNGANRPVEDFPVMQEVVADRGERLHVTFNDGTSVVLNSSSVVRFPKEFDEDIRQVELEGEAFFSVARKEDAPFVVHTDEATVRVLGTKFNVNAYPRGKRVEIVVAEGKVAVSSELNEGNIDRPIEDQPMGGNEVILKKGDYTVVEGSAGPTSPKKVVLEQYLSWIDGRLIFKATPLDRVLDKLELYYDRDFIVDDSTLYNRRLTASFDKESFSKVLEVLSVALNLNFEEKDSLIHLKPM